MAEKKDTEEMQPPPEGKAADAAPPEGGAQGAPGPGAAGPWSEAGAASGDGGAGKAGPESGSGAASGGGDAGKPAAAPRAGGLRRTLGAAAAAAAVALGGAGAYLHFRVGGLEEELAAQRAAHAATERARAELADEVAELRSAAARRPELEALTARTAVLEAERSSFANRSEIDSLAAALRRELLALDEKVGGLALTSLPDLAAEELLVRLADMDRAGEDERAWNRDGVRAAALVLAADRLLDRVGSGLPYAPELEAARALLPPGAGGEDPLAPLEPHADSGVPAADGLLAGFPAPAGGRGPVPDGEGAPFWRSLLHRLSGLVEVRRTALPGGDSPEAALARAAAAARAGDLPGALAAAESVPDAVAPGIGEWRDGARRTAAALGAARALGEEADAALLAFAAGSAPR